MNTSNFIKNLSPLTINKNILLSIISLIIFFLYLNIYLMPDLKLSIPQFTALNAVIIIFLCSIPTINKTQQRDLSLKFILFMGLIVRLLFLFHSPQLSDDIYRYVFDGNMILMGNNPYSIPPSLFETNNQELLLLKKSINHSNLITIYPPAAQLTFSLGALLGGVIGMKLLLIILDIFSCFFIIKILKKLKLPLSNAVLYAWHPLPVIEIASSGHIEGATIFFTIFTIFVLVLTKNSKEIFILNFSIPQWFIGFFLGIVFSMAVLSKWVPLIFTPGIIILLDFKNIKYILTGFIISSSALFIFFYPDVVNSFDTLVIYAANWEFSGFIFRTLRYLTNSGKIARFIIASLFISSIIIIYLPYITKSKDTSVIKPRKVFRSFYLTSMVFIFLTPTLHPWYLLYLIAFLPFNPEPAGIVFSWSIFLSYRVVMVYALTGEWSEDNLLPFLIFIGPCAVFMAKFLTRVSIRDYTSQ